MSQAVNQLPTLNLPCEVLEVYDGDTATVQVKINVRVRLLDCWAPELRAGGKASREHLKEIAPVGKEGVLQIPLGGATRLDDLFTFGRILGDVWIDGESVVEQQIGAGHAWRTKEDLQSNSQEN